MIKSITLRLSAWRRERETFRELSMLTDRELADLGIARGDVASVATGTFFDADEVFAPAYVEANDAALIGPAWAAHAPTSLAA